MRKKLLLLLMFCITLGTLHGQTNAAGETAQAQSSENIALHRVLMGETVVLLAKKYKMTPQDIYEYNPGASEGISQGMTLRIPLHRQVDLSAPKPQKEAPAAYTTTNTPKQKPENAAPVVKPQASTALPETGPVATTPVTRETPAPVAEAVPAQPKVAEAVIHTVQHGETLYGLAQKYGVSVNDIKQQNEDVKKRGLHVGQVLSIQQAPSPEGYTAHHVQQGETLYSLSRKYGVSVGQISDANKKALKNGLMAGQTLQIPASHAVAGTGQ